MFDKLKQMVISVVKFGYSMKDSALAKLKFLLVQEKQRFKRRSNIFSYLGEGTIIFSLAPFIFIKMGVMELFEKKNPTKLIITYAGYYLLIQPIYAAYHGTGYPPGTEIGNIAVLGQLAVWLYVPALLAAPYVFTKTVIDEGNVCNKEEMIFRRENKEIMDIIRTEIPLELYNKDYRAKKVETDLCSTDKSIFLRGVLLDFADYYQKTKRNASDLLMIEALKSTMPTMPREIVKLILWQANESFKDSYLDGTNIPEIEQLRKEEISKTISKYKF